jgi:acetolactate synthase-1/3 small subunit
MPPRDNEPVNRHVMAVLVDNEAGVLARVIGLFSARGYNIDSLTVAEVDVEGHTSRITVVTSGPEAVIEQIKAQLERLVPVHKVVDLTADAHIERELALVKVAPPGDKRAEALRLAEAFGARVMDQTQGVLVFELTGLPEELDVFADRMRPLGLVDVCRTGVIALALGAAAM